jgi:hypothetical protein
MNGKLFQGNHIFDYHPLEKIREKRMDKRIFLPLLSILVHKMPQKLDNFSVLVHVAAS